MELKNVHLSQNQLVPSSHFKVSQLNLIIAPVGVGKTTYLNKTFPIQANLNSGIVLVLVPLITLKHQIHTDEHTNYTILGNHNYVQLETLLTQGLDGWGLESELNELMQSNPTKTYCRLDNSTINLTYCVATIQSFANFLLKDLQTARKLMSHFSAIVLDEVDMMFEMGNWGGNGAMKGLGSLIMNELENARKEMEIEQLKQEIRQLKKEKSKPNATKFPIWLGISATGQFKLESIFGVGKWLNLLEFRFSHYELEPKFMGGFNDIKQIAPLIISQGSIAIFQHQVKSLVLLKTWFETNYNLKVALLTSESAENYKMNDYDHEIRRQLTSNGRIGDEVCFPDVLMFNASLYRGINILDQRFVGMFVNEMKSEFDDDVIQSVGRFRWKNMKFWVKQPKCASKQDEGEKLMNQHRIEIAESFCGQKLNTELKQQITTRMGFLTAKKQPAKWLTTKKWLEENGFEVVNLRNYKERWSELKKRIES
jgi:hypothetical protein